MLIISDTYAVYILYSAAVWLFLSVNMHSLNLILKKTLCILFIFTICFQPVLADTFIVTTNADSGPGSLRQAIENANANGATQTDYIYFDIPDVTIGGRTITLSAAFPDLTSNIVIDGSTQPGAALGLSGAKIVIQVAASAELYQFVFVMNHISDVEIYGLKITDEYVHTQVQLSTCFYIYQSTGIKIGAAGKGNVITKWTYALRYFGAQGFSRDFVMSSNFIGLNEDGETPEYNEYAVSCSNIQNATFGGMDPEDGNVVAGARTRVEFGKCTGNILVANNKIGSNYNGTKALNLPLAEANHLYDNITIENSIWYSDIDYSTTIKVLNNLSTGTCAAGVRLTGYAKKFYIQGNRIGTDITGTHRMNDYMDVGVLIESSGDKGQGIIGVENDEKEKNIIAFAKGGSSGGTYQIGSGVAIANGRGITISRNSIFCDQNKGIIFDDNGPYIPSPVTINYVDAGTISGTASPGALIEFFRDDDCVNCEGKTFLGITTNAGTDGKWSLSNINTENIVVTATDTGGQTSEFSAPGFLLKQLVVKNASCGKNNGSISGIKITSGTRWIWQNKNGNIVGTDTALQDVGPGLYRLVIGIGSNNCDIKTEYFEIIDESLPDALSQPEITQASCGANNGSLFLNYDISQYRSMWENAAGDSIGKGIAVDKLLPGSYFLRLTIMSDSTCTKEYGPYEIINQSGPHLNINNIIITPASCGNPNGSVSNIIPENTTGTIFFAWLDSLDNIIANTLNLTDAPPGKYKLKFKDGGGCDTITTSYFTIKEQGRIYVDSSGMMVKPAGCSLSNGAINGIITNAELIQWKSMETGSVAGNTIDIFQLPSGKYELMLGNQYGCSETAVVTVPSAGFASIAVKGVQVRPGLCGQTNGYIYVTGFNADAGGYSFLWKNSQTNQAAGTGAKLENLGEGTYELIATDINGCTQSIFDTSIKVWPNPVIDLSVVKIFHDQCSLQQGAIADVQVLGLQTDNISWVWKNENQVTVSLTKDMDKIPAGKYILSVTDDEICTISSEVLIVENHDVGIADPVYDDKIIPRFSKATLSVKNFSAGKYQLFSDATATQLLDQNETGVFVTEPIDADRELYIRHIVGSCSSMKKVKIAVVDKSFFAVPSAFTPNNDKLNDDISVNAVGYIEIEYFRIFNRFGKEVFRSNNINDRWNGKVNGKDQPSSVFIWMAKGKDINGNPITGKGTIMLIR